MLVEALCPVCSIFCGDGMEQNFVLLRQTGPSQRPLGYGAVAQLIERVVRNDEVVGLIPICSTILRNAK